MEGTARETNAAYPMPSIEGNVMKPYVVVAIAAMVLSLASSGNAEEKTVKFDGWKVVIAPQEKPKSKKGKGPKIDPAEYQRVYNSIPFNRAEYRANPSYRHEATMEILFGKMRDTVIHKTQPQRAAAPRAAAAVPWRYNRNVSRYGLNYSFYFPYWNARGMY